MRKPTIGLTPLYDVERESFWMLPDYMDLLRAAGAVPIILPPVKTRTEADDVLNCVDGLLLTGGQDVDPALYGASRADSCGAVVPERDASDLLLLKTALNRKLPVLGVCRGLQLLNAALGGTLWQDLPSERPSEVCHSMQKPYDAEAHRVTVLPETPLAALLDEETIPVNSRHHQAIRDLAPVLRPMAISTDGLIEAFWMPEQPFVWGVQWHPEHSFRADDRGLRIANALVRAAAPDTDRLGFYGADGEQPDRNTVFPTIRTPRDLYRVLLRCWSSETCASRMRKRWSPENPTLGQCSITSFLVQDLFGGIVRGVPLENGYFHCYNVVDGCILDLTSEQFRGEALDYRPTNPIQTREQHFAMPEKQERYEFLRAALLRELSY
ncbi:MAG: gamma-glutamyl-gamma-aminobutyrate hydrolase family protein [Oscillospiraceae bacterium]|nr:gamma-glutamyl-gamma-aminobutyrate hydrolase family protein [Oscillospiraceae bacterium]